MTNLKRLGRHLKKHPRFVQLFVEHTSTTNIVVSRLARARQVMMRDAHCLKAVMTRRPFRTRSKPESKPDSGFESRNQNFRFPVSGFGWGSPAAAPCLPAPCLGGFRFPFFPHFSQFSLIFSPFSPIFHHFPPTFHIFPDFSSFSPFLAKAAAK